MKLLEFVRARRPDVALLTEDGAVSWRELDDRSRAFSAWERAQGVARGDRVAVIAAGGVGAIVALLAHHRSGVVHVPVNPAYQDAERRHIIDDCGARLVLDEAALREGEGVSPASTIQAIDTPLAPDETALLIYTSGTTGRSKGCTLTAANLEGAVGSLAASWEIGRHDVVVNALPLFHVHGLCVALHAALLTGARTRLVPKFSPRTIVDAFSAAHGDAAGTIFMGVPTMYRRLLAHLETHPEDAAILARARLFTSGSAPLPAADLEAFEKGTGHRILERYGMSETLITLSNPLHGERKAGTVGRAIPGVEIRIVEGELQVRGPGVMRGYWNDPDNTARTFAADDSDAGAPWLKTGDLVAQDDDGYITILGRAATDFVKVGGFKVSTREVEERIASYPGVQEVAVVGVPDVEWGERIVACLVLDPAVLAAETGAALEDDALLARLQAHVQLAAHKWPRQIAVLDALPRNAMGKVQKKLLAQRLQTRPSSSL